MTFESPVQPVTARGRGMATVVLVAVVGLAAVLVWQPWGGNSHGPAQPAELTAAPTTVVAGAARPPFRAAVSALSTPRLVTDPPSADIFQPRWSVVGVSELPRGRYRITELPVEPTSAIYEGLSSAQICARGRAGAPSIGVLPGSTLRLFGAIAPHGGQGWVELTWVDPSNRVVYTAPVRYPPGTEDLGVALFGLSDRTLWPPGAYRFSAVSDDGSEHHLYACLSG